MKIEEVLKEARKKLIENKIEDASVIARVLLQFTLKLNRSDVILRQEQEIPEEKILEYETAITKIIEGIPMQYITKTCEFYGLNFYVNENVLIPQPDTEILVEEVIKIIEENRFNKVIDICSGSGCIGISIAKNVDLAQLTMLDIDRLALKVSKINSEKLLPNKKINYIESDMFEELEEEYDIIVSNPPYIETSTIKTLSKQVQNEPISALDGGEDGLEFYKILIDESHKYLSDEGYLCMEIGYNQKEKVIELLEENGNYTNIYAKQDLSGNDRIVVAQRKNEDL